MRNLKTFCKSKAAVVMMLLTIAVVGCGKEEGIEKKEMTSTTEFEEAVEELSVVEEVEENLIDSEFGDIPQEILDSVIDIEEITEEHLRDMTIDEFKAFIKKYSPNYRTVYNIPSDKVMEDKDWETLKMLVNYNLFGKLWLKEESVSENSVSNNSIEKEIDKEKELFFEAVEWKESGLTIEDIEEMILLVNDTDVEELKETLLGIFIENDYEEEELSEMDKEKLEELKENLLAYLITLRENYSYLE